MRAVHYHSLSVTSDLSMSNFEFLSLSMSNRLLCVTKSLDQHVFFVILPVLWMAPVRHCKKADCRLHTFTAKVFCSVFFLRSQLSALNWSEPQNTDWHTQLRNCWKCKWKNVPKLRAIFISHQTFKNFLSVYCAEMICPTFPWTFGYASQPKILYRHPYSKHGLYYANMAALGIPHSMEAHGMLLTEKNRTLQPAATQCPNVRPSGPAVRAFRPVLFAAAKLTLSTKRHCPQWWVHHENAFAKEKTNNHQLSK